MDMELYFLSTWRQDPNNEFRCHCSLCSWLSDTDLWLWWNKHTHTHHSYAGVYSQRGEVGTAIVPTRKSNQKRLSFFWQLCLSTYWLAWAWRHSRNFILWEDESWRLDPRLMRMETYILGKGIWMQGVMMHSKPTMFFWKYIGTNSQLT